MKARGRGVIVNVIGTAGDQMPAAYAAGISANSALVALTRALGGESLDHGVRVVGGSPGALARERGRDVFARGAGRVAGRGPRVRASGARPGDVANARGIDFLRRQADKEFGDPGRWRERLARLPG